VEVRSSNGSPLPHARWVSRWFLGLGLLLLALVLPASPVLADAKQEARTTFERGVEASRAQQWEEARTQFKRSLELLPKASTMFNLAVADIKLGLGREALEQLDAFENAATEEHGEMVERARVLRPQAQALVESEQATAQSGGNQLSRNEVGVTDEVRRDVEKARENYARGHDRESLAGFERAYRISKRPELLYNIGVVADRLRDDRRAVRAYDQFVEALPDAPEAAVAQVRAEALRNAIEEREGREARSPERAWQPEGPANKPDLLLPRFMIVSGVVLPAVSLSLLPYLLHRIDIYDECLQSVGPNFTGEKECDSPDEARRSKQMAQRGVYSSVALAAVGLGVTAAGAVLLVKRKRAAASRTSMLLVPSLALGDEQVGALSVVGSF
jgi:tetratricopeptide (TPR) repeat protein